MASARLSPALPVHHAPAKGGRRGREAERWEATPPTSNHPLTGGAERGCKHVWSPHGVRTGRAGEDDHPPA